MAELLAELREGCLNERPELSEVLCQGEEGRWLEREGVQGVM